MSRYEQPELINVGAIEVNVLSETKTWAGPDFLDEPQTSTPPSVLDVD